MDSSNPSPWDAVTSFALVRLGHLAHRRFAEKLMPLGLRPRQVGVLDLLRSGARTQSELAQAIGVTPSVVVDMVDELEDLGAVRRVRDRTDRRRQNIELTSVGRRLSTRALRLGQELDADLLAQLDDEVAAGLREALQQIVAVQQRDGGWDDL